MSKFVLESLQPVIIEWREMSGNEFLKTATGRVKFFKSQQAAVRYLCELKLRKFFRIREVNPDGIMI